jgi:hypothetical protein
MCALGPEETVFSAITLRSTDLTAYLKHLVTRATKLKANQLLFSACGCGKKLKTWRFRYFRP